MPIQSLSSALQLLTPQTLVVLDIDSTLIQTHKRNEAILRHFAKDSSHSARSVFEQAECFPLEYGYSPALARLGIPPDDEVAKAAALFWREHFFSNHFLHHDLPHPGAVEFVEQLQQRQIPHVYLTGRPRPLMWEGTLKILQQLGFSVTEDSLFLKPHPQDVDEIFKSQTMHHLKKGHSQVLFIDNEPRVLNLIDKDHPDIHLIFVDTCHSPNVTPPTSAFKIKDFKDLVSGLRES